MDDPAGAIRILGCTVLANMGTPLVWAPIGQLLIGNFLIGAGEGWPGYLLLMAALTFVLTVVLEWPACFSLLFGRERVFRKSWIASLLAQSASYGFLVAYYLNASAFSLYTRVEVTPELLAALPDTAAVYFESAKDGETWRVRLNGQRLEPVTQRDQVPRPPGDREMRWQVLDRRPPGAAWDVRLSFWSFEGIEALHRPTGRSFRAALETPFLSWRPSQATLLPGDLVVCQLGSDQIVVLDLNARRLALLATGRSPVVVLDPPPVVLGGANP